ncbi:MAG: hypothetical protein ABL901_11295 [Hyphomicrobiaceae bacterium]
MGWRGVLVLAGLALAGCAQTSRVDENVTPAKLASAQKGVALIRVGSASPTCLHTRVLLGTRAGEGYKRGQVIMVANLRSITASQVAEVALEPGEHHIIGYSCVAQNSQQTFVSDPAGGQLMGTSYARFSVAAGEIVNVGYFHFGASKEGRSLFGRNVRTDVEITDWPLAEIERFKQQRPTMYAQMTTRLMTVGGVLAAGEQARICEKWQALKAEGKAADVPPECGGAMAAVKKTKGRL